MTSAKWCATAAAAVVLGFAGCGGGDEPPGTGQSGSQQETQAPAADQAANGKELFANTCGGCHTLKAAGTNGQVGPVLDEIKPDKELVLATIKAGPGAMPSNLLEGAEADAVATYVSENAGK